MSEEEELAEYLAAEAVAEALKDGDFDAFSDLVELLEASRANENTSNLLLGIIWALLPDEAHDKMVATAQAEGKSNVIDLITRKPRSDQ
jgi:hypothetical protein